MELFLALDFLQVPNFKLFLLRGLGCGGCKCIDENMKLDQPRTEPPPPSWSFRLEVKYFTATL